MNIYYSVTAVFILLLGCFPGKEAAAQKPSCCNLKAISAFAALANSTDFREKHDIPKPFAFQSATAKKISFKCPDGKMGYGYEWKASEPTDNYVFVFHEWWGLNDYIKRESEGLFNTLGETNIIALDLYDGKTAANRDEASKLVQSVSTDRAVNIIKGAAGYVGDDADIATIGWCFGGGWSLQASIILEGQSEACVIFYGMPEQDKERLEELKAPVLGIFAKQDGHITPEIVQQFENNLDELDKKATIRMYDAQHAFANPSGESYNSDAAKDAMSKAVTFIHDHLID